MTFFDLTNDNKACEKNPALASVMLKSEMKKIDRRIEDIANSIEDYISSETEFISKNGNLSKEEQEELLKRLKSDSMALPQKMKEKIDFLFDGEGKEPESKEEQPKQKQPDAVPVSITPGSIPASAIQAIADNYFGA